MWITGVKGGPGPEPLYEVTVIISCWKVNQTTTNKVKITTKRGHDFKDMQSKHREMQNNLKDTQNQYDQTNRHEKTCKTTRKKHKTTEQRCKIITVTQNG